MWLLSKNAVIVLMLEYVVLASKKPVNTAEIKANVRIPCVIDGGIKPNRGVLGLSGVRASNLGTSSTTSPA